MPPLREPTYFTLAALLDGPKHGYAILQQVSALSEDRVHLSTGTLYGALDRLAGEGLISAGEPEVVGGRTRRTYSLTSAGRTAVHAEAERMTAAARVVTGAATRGRGIGAAGTAFAPGWGMA
ncbi:PadR family transcriptional regulator [Kineococcus rubinsiae]|uniref:PadR family transcriptional regulator n=1 Tax=Kineococcus rubinsiae TaxID=2609562 RepID=UPI00142F57A3|nr:PadR family transcriptional regulator [Kineococcus rubinsiae]NIZ90309.1 PadR family transcriptional regulator [Kineococcus rubinsiae]